MMIRTACVLFAVLACAVLPVRLEYGLEGETFGSEGWGTALLSPWWRL